MDVFKNAEGQSQFTFQLLKTKLLLRRFEVSQPCPRPCSRPLLAQHTWRGRASCPRQGKLIGSPGESKAQGALAREGRERRTEEDAQKILFRRWICEPYNVGRRPTHTSSPPIPKGICTSYTNRQLRPRARPRGSGNVRHPPVGPGFFLESFREQARDFVLLVPRRVWAFRASESTAPAVRRGPGATIPRPDPSLRGRHT